MSLPFVPPPAVLHQIAEILSEPPPLTPDTEEAGLPYWGPPPDERPGWEPDDRAEIRSNG